MMSSASGKVILLGEHAVVYGVPAIVLGIDRGARAAAHPLDASYAPGASSELALTAEGRGQTLVVSSRDTSDLGRAFGALLDACEVSAPVRVEATADLPAAAGPSGPPPLRLPLVPAPHALLR